MRLKIDKSLFTAEERAQYEALISKALVDPEAAEEEMGKEAPPMPPRRKKRPPFVEENKFEERDGDWEEEDDFEEEDMDKSRCKKSADPELAKALERLETLEKSIAMDRYTEIAKKYAPLGENETVLARTLYNMEKSNKANYDAYIDVLDKSLDLVEKSGIFAEIGKSGAAYGATYGAAHGTVDKVEQIASEIRKSNPEMSYEHSIAKAWEENPELIAEYDAAYNGRK